MTLEQQFEKETGTPAINSQGEPDIDFVEWLKEKLTSKREERRFEAASRIAAAMIANGNEQNAPSDDRVKQHIERAAKFADALMQALSLVFQQKNVAVNVQPVKR